MQIIAFFNALSAQSACHKPPRRMRSLQAVFFVAAVLCLLGVRADAGWAATAYTTQAFDNAHSNWNPNETQLTVASVKAGFGPLFQRTLDGQVYAQPLYLPNLNMGTLGTHNVVFIATEANSVYAFDADTAQAPLWKANLTPSGETLQVSSDYNNTRIPHVGISSTPVIDTSSNTIYVVAASKTTSTPAVFHQRLHALDVTTGQERTNSPRDIQAKYPGTGGIQDGHGNVVFDPLILFNRPGLLLFNGMIYTAWGSHEDNGTYQGWVIAYDKTTLQQTGVYNTAPNQPNGTGGGSIWQSSVGMVADSDSVYFLAANGLFDANTGGVDYGDTAVRLGTNFQVLDYFTPCNQKELNDLDVDLGSGAPMLLPTQSTGTQSKMMVFAGKEGSIYLADRTNMGKYTPTTVPDTQECNDNVVQELWRVLGTAPTNGNASRDAFWGAPAYFQDASGNQTIYFSGNNDFMRSYSLANGVMTATSMTPDTYPSGGSLPTVSSNAGAAGSDILWAIKRANSSDGQGPLALEAYDATNLTSQIVTDMPAGNWSEFNYAFLIPTVVNGKVYVASDGQLQVFGLTAASNQPVKIAAPVNGATVSGSVPIDANLGASTVWINVYIDGKYFASSPPSSFTWDSTTVADGTHTISANAYGSGGTLLGSDSVTVTVSNSIAKIVSPANGSTVSGTVSIATQLSSQAQWENVYIDGKYLASSPPFAFSWDSTTVPDGQHTISIKAFSSANQQIGADSVTVNVSNSAVSITSPANGATVFGTISIATTVSSAVAWENIYLDGKYLVSSPPYTFTWNTTAVPNGTHTISARGFAANGTQVGSASVTVNVNNGAAAITSPANGATVSGSVSIVTQVGAAVVWENVYIDGKYFASSPPYTFTWNSASVPNGAHSISVKAFGQGGTQIGSASISVMVSN